MNLRPYQTEAIAQLRQSFADKHKRVVLCLPTGSGKTVVFSEMVRMAAEKGTRTLVLTDRIELFNQTFKAMGRVGVTPQMIHAKGNYTIDPYAVVSVGMVETVKRRVAKGAMMFPEFIVIDECFPSDTLIDGRPIKDIEAGEYVKSYNHESGLVEMKKVLSKFVRPMNDDDFVLISYPCGLIRCTKEHPIFVKNKGYVTAESVEFGDEVLVLCMPKRNNTGFGFGIEMEESDLLKKANNMLKRVHRSFQVKKAEGKKPYDELGGRGKDEAIIEGDWSQAHDTGRQREGHDKGTISVIGCAWRWMVCGVGRCYEKWRKAIPLQNRHWLTFVDGGDRSRWNKPQHKKNSTGGPKENQFFNWQRVQGVKIQERRNTNEFADGLKYNIEVEDNNNYFANGVLVHNCHKGNFTAILELFPSARVIGATATPVGKHFYKYYTDIVQNIDIPDLVESEYLAECRAFQMQDDLSDLQTRAGEYTEESLFGHYNSQKLFDGVIEQYRDKANGTKAIVFNVNIAHTENMTKAFNDAGIRSECVTSKTPKDERARILRAYSQGLFPVLNNCGILTTGYDEPTIETVIMNRATKSLPLWLQCCGRGSRVIPNVKTQFTVLDFGMNHDQHGMWSEPRTWKIRKPREKGEQPAPVKECPSCNALVFASARSCRYCGHEFQMEAKPLANGQMVQVTPKVPMGLQGKRIGDLSLIELIELEASKTYKASFIWRVVRSQGKEAIREYARMKGHSSGWCYRQELEMNNSEYSNYLLK